MDRLTFSNDYLVLFVIGENIFVEFSIERSDINFPMQLYTIFVCAL